MDEELVVETVSATKPIGNQIIFVILGVGAAAAVGYFVYRKFFNEENEAEEREVAYTYEDAVAKAKARLVDSGKDDGVKLAPSEDKPSLKGNDISTINIDVHDKASYDKIAEEYVTVEEESDSQEEETPEKNFTVITEEIFRYENPFNIKSKGTFSKKEGVLTGWNNEYDQIDEPDLVKKLRVLCSVDNHDDIYWFSCDEEASDYEIEII